MKFILAFFVCLFASAVTVSGQSVLAVHQQLERITEHAEIAAAQSGNWSDPMTWGEAVPPDGATVEIPDGVTVTVDGVIPVASRWIRVDGVLRWAPDVTTNLTTETLVVMGGRLEIGTPSMPIASGVTASMTFRSNGQAISHTLDPLELTRGLIAMTPVVMVGQAKRERVSLAVKPAAGSTTLDLEQDPDGWAVGDEILIAPTLFDQDEVVRVEAIEGRHVTFTPALKFARTNTPDFAAIRIHAGNLTRNVLIRTDPMQAGDVKLQGHVMLMGGGHDIRHVAFLDTGRTTIKPVSDPILLPDGTRDPSLMPLCGLTEENVRGRYALHFHNPGPASDKSNLDGVVVRVQRDKGLRVGIQSHSANLDDLNPIVHNIDGSGLFFEEGDERGTVTGAFLVHAKGNNSEKAPLPQSEVCQKQNYLDIWNRRRAQFGDRGGGIWLQGSGNVIFRDNVIAGMAHAGIDHKAEGLDKRKANTFEVRVRPDQLPGGDSWVRAKMNAYDYDPTQPILGVSLPPLVLIDTQVYAIGDSLRYSDKAAFTSSGMGLQMAEWPLRPKNLFTNFLAWNVGKCVQVQYGDWGRLENVTCIGGFLIPGSRPDVYPSAHAGVQTNTQGGRYWQYVNMSIDGFGKGYEFFPSPGSTFSGVTVDGKPYVPTIEACGDDVDNDGDGRIDEGCLP